MSEDKPIDVQPLVWRPTAHSCPRCSQPLKARLSKNFMKVLELLCTKCGWRMNIEALRKAAKAIAQPPDEAQEDNNDAD